ncbi:hypothetical protein O9992_23780 [Vibrio lentus]|nr:hypothetical protein [Vibrio lentus]
MLGDVFPSVLHYKTLMSPLMDIDETRLKSHT